MLAAQIQSLKAQILSLLPTPDTLHPTTMTCINHPKTETLLRCGKCDRPICTECMLMGPAGVRCRDCAALRSSPMYQITVNKLAVGLAGGLAAATLGGYLLALVSGFGLMALWLGLFVGIGVGETVLRITQRKRARSVEVGAGACVFVGAEIGLALWAVSRGFPVGPIDLVQYALNHPFYATSIGLAIFTAVSRVRFF